MLRTTSKDGVQQYVMIETYRTQADLDAHFTSDDVATVIRAFQDEELLAGEIRIANCTDVAGFVR
jgi:quinol monooxygenase YgiN